jgi:hypothetical protein
LLQPTPEPLKVNFGQFFAHILFTLAKEEYKSANRSARHNFFRIQEMQQDALWMVPQPAKSHQGHHPVKSTG